MNKVFLLYREISDQYGTTEIVGIYSSAEKAARASTAIGDRRTFVKEWLVDAGMPKGYTPAPF